MMETRGQKRKASQDDDQASRTPQKLAKIDLVSSSPPDSLNEKTGEDLVSPATSFGWSDDEQGRRFGDQDHHNDSEDDDTDGDDDNGNINDKNNSDNFYSSDENDNDDNNSDNNDGDGDDDNGKNNGTNDDSNDDDSGISRKMISYEAFYEIVALNDYLLNDKTESRLREDALVKLNNHLINIRTDDNMRREKYKTQLRDAEALKNAQADLTKERGVFEQEKLVSTEKLQQDLKRLKNSWERFNSSRQKQEKFARERAQSLKNREDAIEQKEKVLEQRNQTAESVDETSTQGQQAIQKEQKTLKQRQQAIEKEEEALEQRKQAMKKEEESSKQRQQAIDEEQEKLNHSKQAMARAEAALEQRQQDLNNRELELEVDRELNAQNSSLLKQSWSGDLPASVTSVIQPITSARGSNNLSSSFGSPTTNDIQTFGAPPSPSVFNTSSTSSLGNAFQNLQPTQSQPFSAPSITMGTSPSGFGGWATDTSMLGFGSSSSSTNNSVVPFSQPQATPLFASGFREPVQGKQNQERAAKLDCLKDDGADAERIPKANGSAPIEKRYASQEAARNATIQKKFLSYLARENPRLLKIPEGIRETSVQTTEGSIQPATDSLSALEPALVPSTEIIIEKNSGDKPEPIPEQNSENKSSFVEGPECETASLIAASVAEKDSIPEISSNDNTGGSTIVDAGSEIDYLFEEHSDDINTKSSPTVGADPDAPDVSEEQEKNESPESKVVTDEELIGPEVDEDDRLSNEKIDKPEPLHRASKNIQQHSSPLRTVLSAAELEWNEESVQERLETPNGTNIDPAEQGSEAYDPANPSAGLEPYVTSVQVKRRAQQQKKIRRRQADEKARKKEEEDRKCAAEREKRKQNDLRRTIWNRKKDPRDGTS